MSELILAAGALVWRPAAGGTEVLLVHRPRYDDWSLPKGKREPGEHLLLTAVREVFEETSVRPVLGPRLPTAEYLAAGRPKRVDYWSAVGPDSSAAASHEIDAVSWVPLAQAAGHLSYAHDATVLAALRPRPTVPLILLRHASAGQRTAHPDDDARRPLDAEGAIDARLLAGLLACFAPAPGSCLRRRCGAWRRCSRSRRTSAGPSRLSPRWRCRADPPTHLLAERALVTPSRPSCVTWWRRTGRRSSNADIICLREICVEESSSLFEALKKDYAHFYFATSVCGKEFSSLNPWIEGSIFIASKYRA